VTSFINIATAVIVLFVDNWLAKSDSLWDASSSIWRQVFYEATIHVWYKKMLGWQNVYQIPRCNQSFVSGMDSSQCHSLHQAFRNLLTD